MTTNASVRGTQRNAIILTSGLTGSSVLTGLISRAGYWTGEKTHKKEYDTFENQELVDLNKRIFSQAGYDGNYRAQFSQQALNQIDKLALNVDDEVYRQFIAKCDAHRPWVWKDPRLWLTIRLWKKFLNTEDCRFIVLSRSYLQCWVSATLRRRIKSYKFSKLYEQSVQETSIKFLEENGLQYLHVRYERLILNPDETISELNEHLGTKLTVDDLKSIYSKPLYKLPRNSWDFMKAVLIYLKNYSERADVQELMR